MRFAWYPLAVLLITWLANGITAQPTAEEFVYPQTTLGGAYNYNLKFTLVWPEGEPAEDTVYYSVMWIKSDEDFVLSPGEGATGSFDSRDELGNLVLTYTISNLQSPGSGSHTMQVWVSFAESLDGHTVSEYELWSIIPWLSALPPVLTLVLAIVTQDVLISLFFGVYSAAFLTKQFNPVVAWLRTLDYYLINSFADSSHLQVILFSWFLSGMVGVISKCGGGHGLAEAIGRLAKTRKSGALFTMLVALCIFFDDYSNCLITGSTMRPITDGLHISREKLSFIVDSTAAPVASLVPVSAWVGFEVSQINNAIELCEDMGYDMEALGYDTNAFTVFLRTIVMRYYPLYMLAMVLLTLVLSREFGPMLTAERRALHEGKVYSDTARLEECDVDSTLDPEPDTPRRWWNGALSVIMLVSLVIIGIFLTGYYGAKADGEAITFTSLLSYCDSYSSLLYATATASVFQFLVVSLQWKFDSRIVKPSFLGGPKGAVQLLSLQDAIRYWIEGLKNLTAAVLTLILAWSIGMAIQEVGAATYISGALAVGVDPRMLPFLTFLIAAVMSLATGTSWGTMSIMFPIAVPAAVQADPGNHEIMYLTTAAILAGAVFGDHCTPISDTTILSAMASRCDLRHHVVTQLPYAITVGMLAAVLGYLLVGYNVYPDWAAIPIGWVGVLVVLFLLGASIEGNRRDVFGLIMAPFNKLFGKKGKDEPSSSAGAIKIAKDSSTDYKDPEVDPLLTTK